MCPQNRGQSIKQHPQKSAQTFVSLLPQVQDVEKIILEHHEKPDGSGFPRGLSQAHINNLATMFIVAENFISLVFDTEIDPTIKRMALKVLERKYSEGNFKKSFEALKKTVGA